MTHTRRERETAAERQARSVRAAAEAAVLATCVPVADRQPGCLVVPGMMAPKFQFDADGRVLPIVAEINRLLEADSDPWGAASWWISHDAYLGGTPAEAIAGDKEEQMELQAAAQRALAPVG